MSIHDEFMALMAGIQEKGGGLVLPPTSFTEMKARVLGFEEGKSLAVEFPFDGRFTNPMGIFQGGMLLTAADNVFGPLSYITARGPCVTLDLSGRFMRPFTRDVGVVVVTARIVSRTKQMIVMEAVVEGKDGKLIATASTQFMILPRAG